MMPIFRSGEFVLSERALGRSLTSIMFIRLFYRVPVRCRQSRFAA
jgi:hypothetical protein